MAQHFLLSAKARTLSLKTIMRMTEDEAHARFEAIRFADNGGAAFCPYCECTKVYTYRAREIWKCADCLRQFSVTSGTIFASRKLPIRDYLAAIAIFVNAVKGISALQLGRDLDVQYKTAFVLAHKLREALTDSRTGATVSGTVEVDGAYFGGRVKEANRKADRKDRRLPEHQSGKRQSVVVARERGGNTVAVVAASEAEAIPAIRQIVQPGSTVHADEAAAWDRLHAHYEMRRINHTVAFSLDGACTNQAEASSLACVGPKSGSTTTSAESTWGSMLARWLGGKILGARRTACCMLWRPARRCGIRLAGFGVGIGSGHSSGVDTRLS